jgi:hypothetical protein
MKVESKGKFPFWVAFGIIFGGALGVLLSLFEMEPIYLIFTTAFGLLIGAIIDLVIKKDK